MSDTKISADRVEMPTWVVKALGAGVVLLVSGAFTLGVLHSQARDEIADNAVAIAELKRGATAHERSEGHPLLVATVNRLALDAAEAKSDRKELEAAIKVLTLNTREICTKVGADCK